MGPWADTLARVPPMAWVFACAAAGVLIGDACAAHGLDAAKALVAGAAVCAIGGVLVPPGARRIVLALALVALSAGWTNHQLARPAAEPGIRIIRGVVLDEPAVGSPASGSFEPFARFRPMSTRFRVRTWAIGPPSGAPPRSTSAIVYVSVAGDDVDISPGDAIELTAWLEPIEAPLNPGGFDTERWAAGQNIVGFARVASASRIEQIDLPHDPIVLIRAAWARASGWAKTRSGALLDALEPGTPAHAVGSALVMGQRTQGLDPVRDVFVRQGIAHLLAVSGLHLGVLAIAAMFAVRLIGGEWKIEVLAAIACALFVMTLVPARPPVLRAGSMVLIFGLVELAGRRYDRLNMLALIAAVMLAWRPSELFSAGYQLSFGVVASLMTLAEPLRAMLFGPRHDPDAAGVRARIVHWLGGVVAASAAAWLVATPIVIHHFGVVSWVSALSSIVLMPLVAVLLAVGYAGAIAGLIHPEAAAAIAPVFEWLCEALLVSARALDSQPWTSITLRPADSVWPIASVITVVVLVRARLRAQWWGVATVVLVGWMIASDAIRHRLPTDVVLRMHTFAVGDGTAHLLRSGNEAMLIDCGSLDLSAGRDVIAEAIRSVGSPPVRTLSLSHADLDHFSAALDVAPRAGVRTALVGESITLEAQQYSDSASAFLLDRLADMNIRCETVKAGASVSLGRATLEVVSPPDPLPTPIKDNDASLVWLVRVPTDAGERTVLLTSDIERRGVDLVRRAMPGLTADVVEAPHHGSARDFAYPFVRGLEPRVVVQSTGPRRLGDERWDAVKQGREWLITARDGMVTIEIWRDGTITSSAYRSTN